jgi:NDP-sugar pyrophosphorylase family protein
LDPKIINSVDGTSYLDMPSLLKDRISNGDIVNAFPIHEYWLDIGQESQYKEAQNNIKDFN